MPNWKKLITSGSAASLSSVTTSGDITIPVTNKIYLDGGGDSYISTTTESSNNNISFVIGGNTRVKMLPHIMYINSTGANGLVINNDEGTTTNSGRIFFEGNSTSVIFQEADDLSFRTGGTTGASSGTERFRVNTSGVAVTGAIDVSGALTLGTALAVAEGGTGATTLTSNGILTGNGTSAIQAESNLTFDGTDLAIAGAGKLYFGGGSHTYISEDADDRLRFFVGGAEFMRFTESTGNSFSIYEDVYIPDDKKIHFGDGNDLKIYHYNAAGDSRINVANNPLLITYNDVDRFRLASGDLVINEGGGDYNFRVEGDTDANLLFVDAGTDRVGIGTSSPAEKLHVVGDVRIDTDLYIQPTNKFYLDGGLDTYIKESSANVMEFYCADSRRMQLTTTYLQVPDGAYLAAGNDNDIFIRHDGNGHLQSNVGTMFINQVSNNSMIFSTSNTERIRINGNGNIGIANISPYEKLDVKSASSTSPAIVANGASANGSFNMAHGYDGANGDYVCTYSTQYSTVGMVLGYGVKASTTASDTFLCSADNSNFVRGAFVLTDTLKFWTAGAQTGTLNNNITMTERFRVTPAGVGHFDNDVVAYSSTVSDKRLKENITTIDNALDKVMELRGVEYDWTATSRKGTHDIGLVAQEVEEVLPELVTEHELCTGEFGGEGNEKTFKTVNYDKMVGVLIEAIKEQQEQINELKEKLNG